MTHEQIVGIAFVAGPVGAFATMFIMRRLLGFRPARGLPPDQALRNFFNLRLYDSRYAWVNPFWADRIAFVSGGALSVFVVYHAVRLLE
jgi:hypothetical protein